MFRANTPPPFQHPWWLEALLVFALAIRLAWCFSRDVNEDAMFRSLPDQREYLSLGRSVFAGDGLKFIDLRFNDEVRAFRPVGYPLLIQACQARVRAVQVAQCAIDASTVLAVVLLARKWLSDRLSLFAGTIVAFNPFLIFFTSLLLTETVFTAMLMWALVCLSRSDHSPLQPKRGVIFFWVGLFILALSIHIRTSSIGLPLVLGIAAYLMRDSKKQSRWYSLPIATSIVLLTIITLLPWAARNRVVLGKWIWTSTNDGFTLYDGLNESADGSSDQSFVAALPQLRTMNEVARSQYLATAAKDWAVENPRRVIDLAGRKLARMWSPIPLSSEYGSRRIYVIAAAAYTLPLFIAAIIGLWNFGLPRSAKILLLLPAIYFSCVHATTIGSLRYRVPVEPPIAILAASAFCRRSVRA